MNNQIERPWIALFFGIFIWIIITLICSGIIFHEKEERLVREQNSKLDLQQKIDFLAANNSKIKIISIQPFRIRTTGEIRFLIVGEGLKTNERLVFHTDISSIPVVAEIWLLKLNNKGEFIFDKKIQ